MANTKIDTNQLIWTPGVSDVELYFAGPSHNGYIKQGDDSSAQIFNMGMGSILFFGVNQKLNFAVKVGAAAQYNSSTFVPKCYVDRNGRIKLTGTGTISGSSFTSTHYITGKNDGKNAYIILELTNNTAGSLNVTPTLIWSAGNMQNYRWQDTGNNDTDVIAFDSTNKYLQITTPGISSMFAGIRACNTVQHYRAQTSFVDVIATYLGAGDLPDTIGTLGTENYIFVQHGATATPTAIGAGATVKFAWALSYASTQAALQTTMAALTSFPTTDLATADAYLTPTKMTMQIPGGQWISDLYDINANRLNFQANSQTISSKQNYPAGSYTFLHPFGRDGYYSVKTGLQSGASTIVSDEFALFKANPGTGGGQSHEVGFYANSTGTYTTASNNGTPGDQDPYQLLKGYEYYVATQDSTWLTNNLTYLNTIGDYLITYYNTYKDSYGIFAGAGASTYPDGAGNVSGVSPVVDPLLASTVAYAIKRLGELNTSAASVTTRTNLVTDPSFEIVTGTWTTYGAFDTIARDNTVSYIENYSYKHVNNTAKDGGIIYTTGTLAAGTYTFSVQAKISSGVTNACMVVRVAGGSLLNALTQTYPGNTNWNRYTFTVTTVSPGALDILLGQGSYGSTSAGTVYYDAVCLESGTTDGSYFDGYTTPVGGYTYAWSGAAEQTTSVATLNSTNQGTYYSTTIYNQMTANFTSSLWNNTTQWLYMNRKPLDNTLYSNKHLPKVDAPLWGVLDTTKSALMATELIDTSNWWDSTLVSFKELPASDALYDSNSYWYGPGWNLTDFKALELVFRYGTRTQAQTAMTYLHKICQQRLDGVRGFMAEKNTNSGVFGFSIGAMQEMITRGLFGIDTHASYFIISPNIYKLGGGGEYKLFNYKMGNQLYNITVRGHGPVQKTYAGGVLQGSNQINYGGNTTILVENSGRTPTT